MENSNFEQEIRKLIDEINSCQDVSIANIPSIDLYMDQVTTFIEESLITHKRNPDDKILTKTMINNYTKDKLLPPPIKKKYTKNHIMILILIYYLKSVLSISDIQRLLSGSSELIKHEDFSTIYEAFNVTKKNITEKMSDNLLQEIEYITENFNVLSDLMQTNESNEKILMIVSVAVLTAQADANKRLAEKIIDNYFKKGKV